MAAGYRVESSIPFSGKKESIVDLYSPLDSRESLALLFSSLGNLFMRRYTSISQFQRRLELKTVLARQDKTIREIRQLIPENSISGSRRKLRKLHELIAAVDDRGRDEELVGLYEEFLGIYHAIPGEDRAQIEFSREEIIVLQTASYFLFRVKYGSIIHDVVSVCTELNNGKPVLEPDNILHLV